MSWPRRVYWWLLRRLPRRPSRWLRSTVVYVASGGRRRAFPARLDYTPIKFTPPKLRLMCLAWQVDERQLEEITERLLSVAGTEPSRIAVVSDCDAVHVFHKRGCRFEFVPPREDWEAHFPDRDYDDFVRHRIDSLLESYRAERMVTFGNVTDGLLRGLAGDSPELAPAVR